MQDDAADVEVLTSAAVASDPVEDDDDEYMIKRLYQRRNTSDIYAAIIEDECGRALEVYNPQPTQQR